MKQLRIFTVLTVFCVILSSLSACAEKSGDAHPLSFKSAAGYDTLKELDGKTVTINGYMATSSPADGSYLFLMNLPYQSCPFCKPNTSELSNTMEVYPKKGESFAYTTQAIRVEGTLAVADQSEPFTDEFGYEFNFKIVDAEYFILSESELSAEMALWQKVAQSDIITEINRMYDYVNFLCDWNEYFVDNYTDENGETHTGYYLYAEDALKFIEPDGAQYHYGYQDGYFDGIISKIRAVDENAFSDLAANVERARALAERALAELQEGHYTKNLQYVEKFDTEDYIYTLDQGEELMAEMDRLYGEYAEWIAKWEV